jgi:hypothetical protein
MSDCFFNGKQSQYKNDLWRKNNTATSSLLLEAKKDLTDVESRIVVTRGCEGEEG